MSTAKQVTRFSVPQRLEHWVLVLSFTILAVTGIPQKFAGDGWAETMIALFGGIETTRVIHHAAAIVLLVGGIYHIVGLFYKVIVLRVRWTIFPQLQDVVDAFNSLLYNLGFRKEAPRFDRFAWGEKFEYWALIWGTVIMAITGFMLWNPIITSRFIQGELIPAAKAAHGGEALLAVLAVLVWHFYNVHLKTFNRSMFTGKLSAHEMEEEHGLELARLEEGNDGRTTDPVKIRRRQIYFLPVAAVAALALVFGIFLFTSAETTAVTTIQRQAGATVQIYAPQTKTPTPVRGATQPSGTAGGIPALPADHIGRTNCSACHQTGAAGPKYPADHAGRTDATCQDCHKPAGAPAGAQETATAASGGGTTPTTAAPGQPTPTTGTAGTPPGVPANHATAGCSACHSQGVGGAPKFPANHSGYADTTCKSCHQPAAATQATAAPTTSAPTDTPAATTVPTEAPAATTAPTEAPAATATTASTGGIPGIPTGHATAGCTACHSQGLGGAPKFPANHSSYTDQMCATCHKPQ